MKLKKQTEQPIIYTATSDSFKDFYELKCNLPGNITDMDIELFDEVVPNGISLIFVVPEDYSISFTLWFETEYGDYPVLMNICLLSGDISVEFYNNVFPSTCKECQNNDHEFKESRLTSGILRKIVSNYLPLIEKYIDILNGMKRKHPCLDDCYYKKQRLSQDGCDKMYIAANEYTPQKDAARQRIILTRKEYEKHKYDI